MSDELRTLDDLAVDGRRVLLRADFNVLLTAAPVDAFAAEQRRYASKSGVAQHLPAAAGSTMEREVNALGAIVDRPGRPLVAVLGGTKICDKIVVLRRFLELADAVCVGGAVCFPFLAARGHSVGYSLCRKDDLELARAALATARGSACRLELPTDLVVARWGQD